MREEESTNEENTTPGCYCAFCAPRKRFNKNDVYESQMKPLLEKLFEVVKEHDIPVIFMRQTANSEEGVEVSMGQNMNEKAHLRFMFLAFLARTNFQDNDLEILMMLAHPVLGKYMAAERIVRGIGDF